MAPQFKLSQSRQWLAQPWLKLLGLFSNILLASHPYFYLGLYHYGKNFHVVSGKWQLYVENIKCITKWNRAFPNNHFNYAWKWIKHDLNRKRWTVSENIPTHSLRAINTSVCSNGPAALLSANKNKFRLLFWFIHKSLDDLWRAANGGILYDHFRHCFNFLQFFVGRDFPAVSIGPARLSSVAGALSQSCDLAALPFGWTRSVCRDRRQLTRPEETRRNAVLFSRGVHMLPARSPFLNGIVIGNSSGETDSLEEPY